MDPLTINAAGGIRTRLESLDLLANNLANSTTSGYKSDQEAFSLYAATGSSADALPLIERRWTDMRQGVIQETGNPLDLALSGTGFFEVAGPNGPLYTRNGRLSTTSDGKLTTKEGYEVQTVEARRIRADPNLPIAVDPSGAVEQQGQILGHLKLVEAPSSGDISKRDGTYLSWVTPAGGQSTPSRAEVRQGALEASNANPAESAVRLVTLMRQFESLQKAAQLGADMNRRAIEDVARPGS